MLVLLVLVLLSLLSLPSVAGDNPNAAAVPAFNSSIEADRKRMNFSLKTDEQDIGSPLLLMLCLLPDLTLTRTSTGRCLFEDLLSAVMPKER